MKKQKKLFYKILFALFFLLNLNLEIVQAATSFSFSVPEGQGAGNNEFYHGRCVRADVMLDTDGHNTGGADLEINYDNARIQIVNNDCNTPATTIYHESQYQNYVNNEVVPATGKITLGSYDNSGTVYNGSGRYAYFYFTILDGAGNYDLDFEFIINDTTESNLAEDGSGDDILEEADSYTLVFADDSDTPTINNLNPAAAAVNVQVISNIQFRLNDNGAGIDISTLDINLTGANWGATNYTEVSPEVTYSCHTTNTNRVDYCDVTLNPAKNLYYCETYTMDITISDLGNPTVHTLNNYTYTFDSEEDNDAPTVYNQSPGDGAGGISVATNIDFSIHDIAAPGGYPGTGVDITTFIVDVSAPGWVSQTYTTASPELTSTPAGVNDYGNNYNYNMSIDPNINFPENVLVTVRVRADDYGCPDVDSLDYTYTFTTADTIAPICDTFAPTQNAVSMTTTDNVTFRCTDEGVGIDINTMKIIVDSIEYTAAGANLFTFAGTPAEYFFTIDPVADLSLNYALESIINGADFSGNQISQISYGLATGTTGGGGGGGGGSSCPVCETCETCETCESCETCEDTVKTITKTEYVNKYQKCEIIKNISKMELLPASSKIAHTQINTITLEKINNFESTDDILITVKDKTIIFEGEALPNSRVTLMIESDPIIITGLSDEEGYWRIKMANILVGGIHEVSAITFSEDNYIVNTKHLSNFKINRFIFYWWYWLIIIFLLLLSIILYKKYKKYKKFNQENICLQK